MKLLRRIQELLHITCFLVPATLSSAHSALRLRGGSSPYELNLSYIPPSHQHPVTLGDLERHNYHIPPEPPVWVATTQASSPLEQIKTYCIKLHRISRTLSLGSLSCILVYILWQIPRFQGMLQRYFVCSRYNIRQGRYVSMLLSVVSHASPTHLLVNLFAFQSFGPSLRQTLSMSNWPLWPLVWGAALFGSLSFVLFGGGGCLGLSGVTLAFLALQARLTPEQEFRLALGGIIPVRMRAQVALIVLLSWSFIGSLVKKSSVAHVTHLGGLLFGMGYYELWTRRNKLRSISYKTKKMLRQVCKR